MESNEDVRATAVRELATVVEQQNQALTSVASQIRYLKGSEARSRNFLRLLAVTLLFDVCLSVGLGFIAFRSNDAARQAKQSVKAACYSGNEVRAEELRLWTYVLNVSSQNPTQQLTEAQKAQQQKTVEQFRSVLNQTFAPRNCAKL